MIVPGVIRFWSWVRSSVKLRSPNIRIELFTTKSSSGFMYHNSNFWVLSPIVCVIFSDFFCINKYLNSSKRGTLERCFDYLATSL